MAKVTLDRETFKALASETRLSLLHSLDERRKTGSELARDLDLNKATVHEHLQLLVAAGLVKKADEGRKWIYYDLSWEGKRLLHPEQGATFAVLLGLSILSAGGAFAMLGRALDWWLDGQGSKEGEMLPTQTSPQPESERDASDDGQTSGSDAPPEESMMADQAPPPEAQDAGDGFWDDGGSISVVLMALTLLFLALAAVLRFRHTSKS